MVDQNKYDSLYYSYGQLENKVSKLENELHTSEISLNSAEYKIRSELEPRIKSEQKSYDSWVISGGSNECFRNGDSGRCGEECTVFCSKDECTQDINDKDLLNLYDCGYIETETELSIRGYNLEITKIDLSVLKEKIVSFNKQKVKLKKNIWKYRLRRLYEKRHND